MIPFVSTQGQTFLEGEGGVIFLLGVCLVWYVFGMTGVVERYLVGGRGARVLRVAVLGACGVLVLCCAYLFRCWQVDRAVMDGFMRWESAWFLDPVFSGGLHFHLRHRSIDADPDITCVHLWRPQLGDAVNRNAPWEPISAYKEIHNTCIFLVDQKRWAPDWRDW